MMSRGRFMRVTCRARGDGALVRRGETGYGGWQLEGSPASQLPTLQA